MKNYTLNLSWDMISSIVLETLKEDHRFLKTELLNLQMKEAPDFYEKTCMENDEELVEALHRVIRYYMTAQEYEAFIKENN